MDKPTRQEYIALLAEYKEKLFNQEETLKSLEQKFPRFNYKQLHRVMRETWPKEDRDRLSPKFTDVQSIIKEHKEELLSENNNVTLATLAEMYSEKLGKVIQKSVFYRNVDKVFTEDEITLMKKLSRQKGVVKYKDVWIEKYGTDNPSKSEDIKEKIKETFREKYGCDYYTQSDFAKEKIKQTCLEKYGVDNVAKRPEFKALYSDKEFLKLILDKRYDTLREKGYITVSQRELEALNMIKEVFPNVIHQYKSKEYPFNCDFYIPELDLYIEFNNFWTHMKKPFDKDNPEHILILEELKERAKTNQFFKNAVYVWTDLDVRHREAVKENNLNFLELWNLDEVREWVEQFKK